MSEKDQKSSLVNSLISTHVFVSRVRSLLVTFNEMEKMAVYIVTCLLLLGI